MAGVEHRTFHPVSVTRILPRTEPLQAVAEEALLKPKAVVMSTVSGHRTLHHPLRGVIINIIEVEVPNDQLIVGLFHHDAHHHPGEVCHQEGHHHEGLRGGHHHLLLEGVQ